MLEELVKRHLEAGRVLVTTAPVEPSDWSHVIVANGAERANDFSTGHEEGQRERTALLRD